jgi:glutamate racemase
MTSPVGIFDSGLGGLSVVSQVMQLLPNEEITYLADNYHVPYGERPLEEIEKFGIGIADFLVERGAKALVIACNMMSAIALRLVRIRHPSIPIIGVIEPGVKSALEIRNNGPIGVLATTGTVKSEAYKNSIARLDSSVQVIQQPCPQFVPIVESGMSDSDEADQAAHEYVGPLCKQGCRVIILGCTHYPFLRSAIQRAAGPDVSVVDPAEATAHTLKNILSDHDLLSSQARPHSFYITSDNSNFAKLGSLFLGRSIDNICHVSWNIDLGQKAQI